ncbi:hypothetical protein [Parvibaculum sp.]|uniref:hypothetical protein n=1 Tax=Parvibaculum sp. TaxID=2024848 RepID=UPI0039191221
MNSIGLEKGRATAYIHFMNMMPTLIAIALLLPAAAAAQEERPTSLDVPELHGQENPAPAPEQRRSFVPGHTGETGTWVRPQYRDGGPPPLGPDGRPRGYRPGGYDSDGRWQPGGPN